VKSLHKSWQRAARIFLAVGVLAGTGLASAQSEWKTFSTPGGQIASPLVLQSVTGKTVDLAQFKGQVVLVNFWASWCEPCRDEMPSLDRLQRRLRDKSFTVLGVNIGEGTPRIKQFLKSVPVDFMIVRDPDSAVLKAWRVRMLPASFLLDKNGMLRYQMVGDADWDEEGPQAPILELLK
jgi:cytochrome c biogenesis protein CcmG/thiol:disulfide interchange protein DsbE